MKNRFTYSFETYSNDRQVKKKILSILDDIFSVYECSEIKMPIFTCINELMLNAVKANFKNLYFTSKQYSAPKSKYMTYDAALEYFNIDSGIDRTAQMLELARTTGLTIRLDITVMNEILKVIITNPLEMTEEDKENVLKKYDIAQSYSTIFDYFVAGDVNYSGESGGLGILFVLMTLKSLGLPFNNLKYWSFDSMTSVVFQIPLNEMIMMNYRSSIGAGL